MKLSETRWTKRIIFFPLWEHCPCAEHSGAILLETQKKPHTHRDTHHLDPVRLTRRYLVVGNTHRGRAGASRPPSISQEVNTIWTFTNVFPQHTQALHSYHLITRTRGHINNTGANDKHNPREDIFCPLTRRVTLFKPSHQEELHKAPAAVTFSRFYNDAMSARAS